MQSTNAGHGVKSTEREDAESLSTGSSYRKNGEVNLRQPADRHERTQRRPGLGNHDRSMVSRVGPGRKLSSSRTGAERLRHLQGGADRLRNPATKEKSKLPQQEQAEERPSRGPSGRTPARRPARRLRGATPSAVPASPTADSGRGRRVRGIRHQAVHSLQSKNK